MAEHVFIKGIAVEVAWFSAGMLAGFHLGKAVGKFKGDGKFSIYFLGKELVRLQLTGDVDVTATVELPMSVLKEQVDQVQVQGDPDRVDQVREATVHWENSPVRDWLDAHVLISRLGGEDQASFPVPESTTGVHDKSTSSPKPKKTTRARKNAPKRNRPRPNS